MEDNNSHYQQTFWQFSDQLRLHTSTFSNLSINDSIWSAPKLRPDQRRNFDVRVGGAVTPSAVPPPQKPSDFNSFDDGWKISSAFAGASASSNSAAAAANGGFSKGIYSKPGNMIRGGGNFNVNINPKFGKSGKGGNENLGGKLGKKNHYNGNKNANNNANNNDNNNNNGKNSVDKRFKTLPPSESLPRNEMIGGYIFVCNNDTMPENLRRELFGLPPRYRDSVRAITPGLPLFLYNYSTHQLHGIFEASSFGGSNIDPTAWEDKKCPGESRFPAQVRVVTRKIFEPLEEDSFRPILHHYDGPKFRLELSIPEALSLLDVFENKDCGNTHLRGIHNPSMD